jgi:hypothetical protein
MKSLLFLSLTCLHAMANLQANIPPQWQLETALATPENQAYQLETSSDLGQWQRLPDIFFGTGQAQEFRVPMVQQNAGFVRLALLGQPTLLGPAPWQLANVSWNTFQLSDGQPGQLATDLTGGMQMNPATASALTVPFTYRRTGRHTGAAFLSSPAPLSPQQLTISWKTPSLCVCEFHANGDLQTSCFTTASSTTMPTSAAGKSWIFAQNRDVQCLKPASGGWELDKGISTTAIPSLSYQLVGNRATLVVDYATAGFRDEYTLTFTSPNGGKFTRDETRGGIAIETVSGGFAVH